MPVSAMYSIAVAHTKGFLCVVTCILHVEHQDALHHALCSNSHHALCADTHNTFGLIYCSLPSPPLPPSSQPMGLMAQDLSLLPLLVVRLRRFFLFYPLSYLYCLSSFALTCTQKGFLLLWLRHAGTCRHHCGVTMLITLLWESGLSALLPVCVWM